MANDCPLRSLLTGRTVRDVLANFINAYRDEIVASVCARFTDRLCPGVSCRVTHADLTAGVQNCLGQVEKALRTAGASATVEQGDLRDAAAAVGKDMLLRDLTIGQLVHVYGDIGQVIAELSIEVRIPIPARSLGLLKVCLDGAVAAAVTGYAGHREKTILDEGNQRIGMLAHELRALLSTSSFAYSILQSGEGAMGGSTGKTLGRSLARLGSLVERSLADARLDGGIDRLEPILVAGFLEEIEIDAALLARAKGIHLTIPPVSHGVAIEGDREILAAAVSNLLQNALKFTRQGASVSLTTHATTDRVLFEVEDECGGLPPGKVEELFVPFSQRGIDRSGVGLGLSICLKAAKASDGEIRVRDIPGKGCVFVLDLPREGRRSVGRGAGATTRGRAPDGLVKTQPLGWDLPEAHRRRS